MIEPMQGEGGMRPVAPEFLRALRKLCDDKGLLLIFDEIQTGMGRTGKLFAHEWPGIAPDIMAIAKGIGGGFPLGACLATAEAAKGMTAGTHGTTYGGNPLAMAVGNAALDLLLAPGFLEHVNKVANYLRQQLGGLVAGDPDDFRGRARPGPDAGTENARAQRRFHRRGARRQHDGAAGGRQCGAPVAAAHASEEKRAKAWR